MVRFNPDLEKDDIEDIQKRIELNNGYCICSLLKDEDHKCMCKEFRNQEQGLCHCGLYQKIS